MNAKIIVFASALLASSLAQAIGPCDLLTTPYPASGNPALIDSYQAKLKAECDLQIKFQAAEQRANQLGVSLDDISLYRALRYVDRSFYTKGKSKKFPVELIYQTTKAGDALPVEKRNDDVWKNWSIGIRQLDDVKRSVMAGQPVTLEMLKRVHAGFYAGRDKDGKPITEAGDFAWQPYPGELKRGYDNDKPWWKLGAGERDRTERALESILGDLAAMGLIPAPLRADLPDTAYPVRIRGSEVYSTDSRMIETQFRSLLGFMNTMLGQGVRGQAMVWKNGQVMTPAEVAFFVQQYAVEIHGFHEGNGRLSRFLQDLVLSIFDLPAAASGDLMKSDVLTPHAEYYALAMNKTAKMIDDVTRLCLKKEIDYRTTSANQLKYECRIVAR